MFDRLWRSFRSARPRRHALLGRSESLPLRLCLEALEDRLAPAVLTVNSSSDAIDHTDGLLNLREALSVVNAQTTTGLGIAEHPLAAAQAAFAEFVDIGHGKIPVQGYLPFIRTKSEGLNPL